MSVFKKPTVLAAVFSLVIFGLSACGGDDSTGNAEEIRGVVKDVASKAKATAETAVEHVEDKIKAPESGTDEE
ncbi:hypothetical protein A9Q90_01390 [Gammaproteobacteria bacterium 54_18_T64]|nr:hypothetical protein A9Q90_01390 [Gammaproteobacteria bacterium 54_18_T64]